MTARWDNPQLPLGWNEDGELMQAPTNAVGWRVRRALAPGPGAPSQRVLVNGVELLLELSATPHDLHAAVSRRTGRYLLDYVDGQGRVLRARPAQNVVRPPKGSNEDLYR